MLFINANQLMSIKYSRLQRNRHSLKTKDVFECFLINVTGV